MPCKTYVCRSDEDFKPLIGRLAMRGEADHSRDDAVRTMIDAVRGEGDAALFRYTRQFDCPDLDRALRISEREIEEASDAVDKSDMVVIAQAAEAIREFHMNQRQRSWFVTPEGGGLLGQRMLPVNRAGLYVPGGKGGETPLISSLLMTAIPAIVAGVPEIAVVSPPRRDGMLNPYILAAADYLGVKEVYRTGGAWAIAALAYGTETVPAVDVIAGPGNAWVTTAKRLVQGKVGIDMIAGPSEVLVLADAKADPEWIAADILSQAEHDPSASAVLVTWDGALLEAVKRCLMTRLETLPRADIARASLRDWGAAVLVSDRDAALRLANMIAPEHMEIMTEDAMELLPAVRHAGAVFLGPYSPEPLGDYMAGPNHVLPTMGTARFSSALSVETFTRRMSVIAAGKGYTASRVASVARLARLERLEAHARSIECRA